MYSTYTMMGLPPTPYLSAKNIYTGETTSCTTGRGTSIDEIILKAEGKIEAVVSKSVISSENYEILFDKSTNTFVESEHFW